LSKRKHKPNTAKPVQTAVLTDAEIKEEARLGTYNVLDAFSNPAARLGVGTANLLNATEYTSERMTQNYNLMNSLYRGNWVVQKIIDTIPSDIVRPWIKLTGDIPPEQSELFERTISRTHVKKALIDGMRWGRLYGGAVGLILLRGDDNLSEPLDLNRVMPQSFKGLYIIDRWNGVVPSGELVDNILSPDFGLPKYYDIQSVEGSFRARVHHTRILRFLGRELPLIERIAEQYWGESEVEAVYEEITKHDNVSHNIVSLTFRANLFFKTVDGLTQMLSTTSGKVQRDFWQTLLAQSELMSNQGLGLLERGDDVKNFTYTFAGLSDIYDSIMMDLAGAANMPVTKLFGRSPAGMNATGESDLQNYYDHCESQREMHLMPHLEKLVPIIALSSWGSDNDTQFTFNPIRPKTDKDVDESLKTRSMVLSQLWTDNLITQDEAREELGKLSVESGMFGNLSDEITDSVKGKFSADMQAMNDPMMGLYGGEDYDDGIGGEEPENPTTPPPTA
jgi:phage-related protein (TIGR01555 family)